MTKNQIKKLNEAKRSVLENPPKELKDIIINTIRSKTKKSSNKILMDMRYGC